MLIGPPRLDADRVTAYCAPGLKHHAALLLQARGKRYSQLIEHPYLAGQTSVILTTAPSWESAAREAAEHITTP